jgi:glycosyltransferase involved in cell wall biosynthesis
MKIAMFTNTFLPHVGGVANSVARFAGEFRRRGHRVFIVAPEFDHQPEDEPDVLRVPAIHNFNDTGFSLALPDFGMIDDAIDAFAPDIVHSHHPFLLGNDAVRAARLRKLPLVFTHHSLYEHYTHYLPGDSETLHRFAIALATSYANLCDHVIAPSGSLAAILHARGVTTPVTTIPTGIDISRFAGMDGLAFRSSLGIPEQAFVIGHVGRLAAEKNLPFLVDAVTGYMKANPDARFLLIGQGPAEEEIVNHFAAAGMSERLHRLGVLRQERLAQAYRAMNVFAFASKSETQGLVLTEAMAAGVPIVALDGPGVRDVMVDGENGCLLFEETVSAFDQALASIADASPEARGRLQQRCLETAAAFSVERCAGSALSLYEQLTGQLYDRRHEQEGIWHDTMRMIQTEWLLASGVAQALGMAIGIADLNGDLHR